jgi:hypothetical protein
MHVDLFKYKCIYIPFFCADLSFAGATDQMNQGKLHFSKAKKQTEETPKGPPTAPHDSLQTEEHTTNRQQSEAPRRNRRTINKKKNNDMGAETKDQTFSSKPATAPPSREIG